MLKGLRLSVYIGAGGIIILFFLVFYVSSKVKSELEHNLNGFVYYFNQQYVDILQSGGVRLYPFICKGIISYNCKTRLDVALNKQTQDGLKVSNINLSFSDIRANSIKIKLSSDSEIVEAFSFKTDLLPNGLPNRFELSSIFKVIDRQDGQLEGNSVLRFSLDAMTAEVNTKYGIRDKSLANKNIIKIVQAILSENGILIKHNLEYMMKNFILNLEGKHVRETFLKVFEMQNDKKYDERIDTAFLLVGTMLPSFGFKDSINVLALQNAFLELSRFLKSQDEKFIFSLEAKNETWNRLSRFSEINLQELLQSLDEHFIFKVGQ